VFEGKGERNSEQSGTVDISDANDEISDGQYSVVLGEICK